MSSRFEQINVHVRDLNAAEVDKIRPWARRSGFQSTVADSVRFAVALSARLADLTDNEGRIAGLPDSFSWPVGSKLRRPSKRDQERVAARFEAGAIRKEEGGWS